MQGALETLVSSLRNKAIIVSDNSNNLSNTFLLLWFILVSRLNSDIQVVQDTLGTNVSMAMRSIVFILTVLVIMLIISPPLTGMVFGGIIPLAVFGNFYAKWMRKLQGTIQMTKAQMNTVAEESLSNVRTVKAFSSEQ